MAELKAIATSLILAAFAAIAPIHALLLTVGLLIFGDMVLGVWAAKKRGEAITSSRLRDTVSKMFIYHMVLILGFLVQEHMLDGWIPIVKLSASVIGIVEIKSVLENSGSILGQPLFKELVQRLGSKSKKQ
jgi:hypothetical protein